MMAIMKDGEKHVDASQMMARVDGEMPTISNNNNRLEQHHQFQEQVETSGGGGARRCRPMEENERTKLREWQRRAITARILAGLWRRGNYNLRVRADINDVIAALAREAGWVVLPDVKTFPSKSQGPRLAGVNSAAGTSSSSQIVSPRTTASLKGVTTGFQSPGELNACNNYHLMIFPHVLGPKVHPLLEMEQVKQRVILLLVAPWIMLATNRLLTYP